MSTAGTVDDHIRQFHLARERGDDGAARVAARCAGIALARQAKGCAGAVGWPKEFELQPYRAWCEEGVEIFGRRQGSQPNLPLNWKLRAHGNHVAHALGRDE